MTIRLLSPGRHVRALTSRAVSYLDDGTQVVWEPTVNGPGQRIACDAEHADRLPRAAVVARFGLPEEPVAFARAWTRAEVVAKLTDTPVLLLLKDGGAALPAGAVVETVVLPGPIVVSTGRLSERRRVRASSARASTGARRRRRAAPAPEASSR